MSKTVIRPERPWVTPSEVKDYSELDTVKKRAEAKLVVDISRAEKYVLNYTHNTFDGYETIPQDVKTAVLLLAEAYAHNAVEQTRSMKSETFDDYAYTAESKTIDFNTLDFAVLLDEWVIPETSGKVTMRITKF